MSELDAADNVTGNAKIVVPEFPSSSLTLPMEIVGRTGGGGGGAVTSIGAENSDVSPTGALGIAVIVAVTKVPPANPLGVTKLNVELPPKSVATGTEPR